MGTFLDSASGSGSMLKVTSTVSLRSTASTATMFESQAKSEYVSFFGYILQFDFKGTGTDPHMYYKMQP